MEVFTIVANEVIGLSATECTLIQFSYNPEQIRDPESVLRSAVKDYLKTDEGKRQLEINCGCWNWGDVDDIPGSFFLNYGLAKIAPPDVNVVVDRKMYCAVMPITHATVEVGSFDTMLVKAIQEGKVIPEGADYQKGPRYNLATLREAVFYRDNYVCKICGRKATEGAILHMHHMFYWKGRHGNSLNELLTVCEKCHTPANHQKSGKLYGFGEKIKFADLSGAAFMNTVRWQIVNELYVAFGKPFVTITYGAMTKEKRIALQLEKSHNNDAYAMGEFHPNLRCMFEHYEKARRNNRILEKFYDSRYIDIRTGEIATGKELFNGRINRNHKKDSENLHKYRGKRTYAGHRALLRKKVNLNPGDLVSLNGENLIVHSTHTKKNGAVNVEFETPAKKRSKIRKS